jgi:D-serine dehydratase
MVHLQPRDLPLDCIDKGIPYGVAPDHRWNVLADDFHFPLLVLKETALAHNIAAMAEWCQRNGFLLAPHGKTTMCPQIYHRQLQAGAWGITVATASQAMVCVRSGIERILIANQLIGRAAVTSIVAALKEIQELEIYSLVDSVESVRQLAASLEASDTPRTLNVLVEWGRPHWRTGARSLDDALRVYDQINRHRRFLDYAGVEGFEGLARSERGSDDEVGQVNEFLEGALKLASALGSCPNSTEAPVFSIGGSAFLDRIGDVARPISDRFRVVVRSGCYVTHDHALYRRRLLDAKARAGNAALPQFLPALELWAFVQSRPDPGVAILTFGKRDCSYDLELPIPLFAVPFSQPLGERIPLDSARIIRLNDQHAYLDGVANQLSVGDRVCCGISHPCTTFDKWRLIPVIDDSYNIRDWYRTYF